MKKFLIFLLIFLIVLLGGGAWWWLHAPIHYRGDQLLPKQALLFMSIPDLGKTRTAYQQTGQYKMFNGPALKPLIGELQKWEDKAMVKNPALFQSMRQISDFLSHAEGEIFMGMTGLTISPQFGVELAVGVDTGKQKTQTLKALGAWMDQLRTDYPLSEFAEGKDRGATYHRIRFENQTLTYGVLGNFILLTIGDQTFHTLVSTAQGNPEETLGANPAYSSWKSKAKDSHAHCYLNLKSFLAPVQTLLSLTGAGNGTQMGYPDNYFCSMNIRGEKFEEVWAASMTPQARSEMSLDLWKVTTRKSLKAADANTLFYLDLSLDFPRWMDRTMERLKQVEGKQQVLASWEQIVQVMQSQGLKIREDFIQNIGNEISLQVSWPDQGTPAIPSINVLAETSNPAGLEGFLDKFTALMEREKVVDSAAADSNATPGQTDPVVPGKIHHYPIPLPMGIPLNISATVQDGMFFFSSSDTGLDKMLSLWKGEGEGLAAQADFKSLDEGLNKEYCEYVYLNERRLVNKVYGWAKLGLGLAAPAIQKSNPALDLSKLPSSEALEEHLGSSALTVSMTQQGMEQKLLGTFGPTFVVLHLLFPQMMETQVEAPIPAK